MSDTLPTPSLFCRINYTPLRDLVRLRLSGRLDWRRVIANSGLPEPARARVGDVVRRTRLWRCERVGVALELIAHFRDGLDMGTPLAELLDGFGDARRTAKLIRRAKKRQRSIIWKARRACTWGVVALAVFYIGLGVYYSFGAPTISVDYTAELNRPAAAVAEQDRAWPVYRSALLAMGLEDRRGNPNTGLIGEHAVPGSERWEETVAYLDQHAASVEQLRAAASMPGLGYIAGYHHEPADLALFQPDEDPDAYSAHLAEQDAQANLTIGILLPHLTSLRYASHVLASDASLAAERGDAATCYADLAAVLRVSRHANEQTTLINQLNVISMVQRALTDISRIVVEYPDLLTDEQLLALAHQVATYAYPALDFLGERAFFYDLLQHYFTDDGHGDGHFIGAHWDRFESDVYGMTGVYGLAGLDNSTWAGASARAAVAPAITTLMGSRREQRELYDRLMDRMVAQHEVPLWLSAEDKVGGDIRRMMEASHLTQIKYLPVAVFLPALGAARQTVERHSAHAEGVMLGLALELYRRETGGYPDALDALVPHYIPELPIDRITGGVLRYRVGDSGPLIYSVGADRDDDGGVAPSLEPGRVMLWIDPAPVDGDWVLWPRHEATGISGIDE